MALPGWEASGRQGMERSREATDWSCTLQWLCTLRAADARWRRHRHIHGPESQRDGAPSEILPACPRRASHLSPRSAAKALGSSDAACEHALLHKDKGRSHAQHACTHQGQIHTLTAKEAFSTQLVTVQQNCCSDHMFQAHVSIMAFDPKWQLHQVHRLCSHTGVD